MGWKQGCLGGLKYGRCCRIFRSSSCHDIHHGGFNRHSKGSRRAELGSVNGYCSGLLPSLTWLSHCFCCEWFPTVRDKTDDGRTTWPRHRTRHLRQRLPVETYVRCRTSNISTVAHCTLVDYSEYNRSTVVHVQHTTPREEEHGLAGVSAVRWNLTNRKRSKILK